MTSSTPQISCLQLTTLLTTSHIFSLFTYIPHQARAQDGSVLLLAFPISFVLSVLLALPLYFLLRRHPGFSFSQICLKLYPRAGKGIVFLLWALFLFLSWETGAQFQYFMRTIMTPEETSPLFYLLLLATAAYLVLMGVEAIARSVFFLFLYFAVSFTPLALSMISDIRMVHITSPLYYGGEELWSCVRIILANQAELLALAEFIPHLRSGAKRAFFSYSILSAAFSVLITFLTVSVLGEYAHTHTYPAFLMAASTSLSFIQRLDPIHVTIWIFRAMSRLTLFLFLSSQCCSLLFRRAPKRLPLGINVLLAAVGALFCQKVPLIVAAFYLVSTGLPAFVFLLLLPTLLQLLDALKKAGGKRGEAS